jgi:hypothetical protein
VKSFGDGIVRRTVAAALAARMIPANRLHLFQGVEPDGGIVEALEHLAALDGEIVGQVSGKEAFKVARSVTGLIAVEVADRLERGVANVQAGAVDQQSRNDVFSALKLARLLLSIDRKRNWFPQLTLERWVHALRRLSSVCSNDRKVVTIGSDLLVDIRSWLQAKPAKPTSHEPEEKEHHELS